MASIVRPLSFARLQWRARALLIVGLLGAFGYSAARLPKNMLDGTHTSAFEKRFDRNLPIREFSERFWMALNYGLLHSPKAGAIPGNGNWLFTEEEFRTAFPLRPAFEVRLAAIESRVQSLESLGIPLAIALIPAKTRIASAHLGMRVPPQSLGPIYAIARNRLNAQSPTPDLLDAYRNANGSPKPATFFQADTHWTPFGAQLAATALAKSVESVPIRRDQPPCPGPTQAAAPETLVGDLVRFADRSLLAKMLGEQSESYPPPLQLCVAPEDALLSDAAPTLVLVGTSYSADPRWGFANALANQMGSEVVNAARSGEGPFAALDALLADGSLMENPPRLIIWEIPERYLWAPCNAKRHDVC